MPLALFGRDEIVQNAVEALCQGKHVAFIGAGGIGKSSIAKAILYDDAVKSRYEDQRYFISFEDLANMDSITLDVFLDRITRSFGFQSSQANNEKLITNFLSSRPAALIVLDNAETFLDARREAGRIADVIDKFGNLSQSVQLVLTTRNRNLTTNVSWTRVVVPGLDLEAAREAFFSIYRNTTPSDSVDSVLTDLDYHPLSINLLANATLQNDWTTNDLVENWKTQHTAILDSGKGKLQSLEFSINLSINSPLIKEDATALNLIKVIAFLPQGVHGKKLKDVFPSVDNIQKTSDTLCKMSLAYRNGDFVTMLSPIRLYVTEKHLGSPAPPYKFPFLDKIRAYYLSNLAKSNPISRDRPKGIPPNVDLIENEDINVERLVVHDLALTRDEATGLQNCLSFLEYLGSHRIRPTGLGAIILPPSESPPPEFAIQEARFPLYINAMRPHFGHRHRLSLCKARCLYHLAGIGIATGRLRDALDFTKAASHIFLKAGFYDGAPGLLYTAKLQGDIYSILGMFKQAEEILTNVLSLTKWVPRCLTRGLREQAEMAVSMTMSFRGRFTEAGRLISKTCQRAQRMNERLYVETLEARGFVCLYGNDEVGAQAYFQQAYDIVKKHGEMTMGIQMRLLFSLSEVLHTKSQTEGDELLSQAAETGKIIGGNLATVPFLMKAGRASDAQQFEAARESIRLASSGLQNIDSLDHGSFQYISARLELLATNYSESKRLFVKAISVFEAISDVRFKARCLRALGEIALLEGSQERAKELFSEVVSTCDFMGMHPQFLYLCFDMYKLDDSKFPGWKSFYEARFPPS